MIVRHPAIARLHLAVIVAVALVVLIVAVEAAAVEENEMNWIFIAIMSGMIVTSSHDTEEACLGRKAIFEKDHKISYQNKCVDMRQSFTGVSLTGSSLPAYTPSR